MDSSGIEVFGYTADIFEGTNETKELVEDLLPVNHKHKSSFKILVDRYDVQLLLENPTILWPSYKESEVSGSVVEDEEEIALQEALDIERYQDLDHQKLVCFESPNTPDFLVLPGPTKAIHTRHTGVPTAEERSYMERWPSRRNDLEEEPLRSLRIRSPEISSEPQPKRRHIFRPQPTAFKPQHLRDFMKEVKEKQATSGLQSRSFWPSSLGEHLCIERTAFVINSLGVDAENELREFVSETLRGEDRIGLGFIFKWHCLHPYYRLMERSKYRYLDYEHHNEAFPTALRSLFATSIMDDNCDDDSLLSDESLSPISEVNADASKQDGVDGAISELRNETPEVISSLLLAYGEDEDEGNHRDEQNRRKTEKSRVKFGSAIRECCEGQNLLESEEEKEITSSKEKPTEIGFEKYQKEIAAVKTPLPRRETSSQVQSGIMTTSALRWKKPLTLEKPLTVDLELSMEETKQERMLPWETQVPNLAGWESSDGFQGVTTKGIQLCHEIGYELFRLRDKELIRLAVQMSKMPMNSPWRVLCLKSTEWSYLQHVILTVLLRVNNPSFSTIPPITHTLDSMTDVAIKLLKNFQSLEAERKQQSQSH